MHERKVLSQRFTVFEMSILSFFSVGKSTNELLGPNGLVPVMLLLHHVYFYRDFAGGMLCAK
ncbi:MAG: hypothetical protein NVS4B9_16550 [Ktedonobacteraceae bacterium]